MPTRTSWFSTAPLSLGGSVSAKASAGVLREKSIMGAIRRRTWAGRHFRNKLVEDQRHAGADGNMAVILGQGQHATLPRLQCAAGCDDASPGPSLNSKRIRSALTSNLVITTRSPGLDGDAVLFQFLRRSAFPEGAQWAVGMEHDALGAERKRAHGKSLVGLKERISCCVVRSVRAWYRARRRSVEPW